MGGHCIPIDPYYLSWKLKTLDYDARFIKLAGEINTQMPNHVVDLITDSLNKDQKALNGSKVLIIGVAYKKDIDDCRESPALDIIKLLNDAGSNVQYFDPYVSSLNFNNLNLKSLDKLDPSILNDFDACAIITDHSNIDFKNIIDSDITIIDTRNVFDNDANINIRRLGEG